VLGQRFLVRLQVLLQRRFVILVGEAARANVGEERRELAREERPRLLDATIEIDRGDERFVAVGEQRLLAAPARLLLAAAEQQMIANLQTLRLARERRRRHEGCLGLRLLTLVVFGTLAKQQVR